MNNVPYELQYYNTTQATPPASGGFFNDLISTVGNVVGAVQNHEYRSQENDLRLARLQASFNPVSQPQGGTTSDRNMLYVAGGGLLLAVLMVGVLRKMIPLVAGAVKIIPWIAGYLITDKITDTTETVAKENDDATTSGVSVGLSGVKFSLGTVALVGGSYFAYRKFIKPKRKAKK